MWVFPAGTAFSDGADQASRVPLDGPITTAPAGSCHYQNGLPDPVCTPGDRDSRFTQDNIASTICAPGWSKQVRPPASVTEPIKKERMRAYGITAPAWTVELDHEIPIGIGGATSTANLWPQPWDGDAGAHKKDNLEDRLHDLVCANEVPLAQAQDDIATNWLAAYQKYVGSPSPAALIHRSMGGLGRAGMLIIWPGQPWRTPFIESFRGRLRDECLDLNLFCSLFMPASIMGDWKQAWQPSGGTQHSATNREPATPPVAALDPQEVAVERSAGRRRFSRRGRGV